MPVIAITAAAPARALTSARRYTDLTGPLPAGVTAARITTLIAMATSLIESYCGRVFARERVVEAVYARPGHHLILERTPVLLIHSVTVDGDPVEPGSFKIIDPDAGIVCVGGSGDGSSWIWDALTECERYSRPPPMARYVVDYVGGYVPNGWPVTDPVTPVTLPAALELACIESVQNMIRSQAASAGLQSEKLGDMSRTYRDDAGRALGGEAPQMLAPYRRMTLPSLA